MEECCKENTECCTEKQDCCKEQPATIPGQDIDITKAVLELSMEVVRLRTMMDQVLSGIGKDITGLVAGINSEFEKLNNRTAVLEAMKSGGGSLPQANGLDAAAM